MTYQSKSDLPETLRATLPDEAQTIYIDAYNLAMKNPDATPVGDISKESAAHAVAWHAVELQFEKSNGKWYEKGAVPETEDESEDGLLDKIRDLF